MRERASIFVNLYQNLFHVNKSLLWKDLLLINAVKETQRYPLILTNYKEITRNKYKCKSKTICLRLFSMDNFIKDNLRKGTKDNVKLPSKTKGVCNGCQCMLPIENFPKYWKTEIPRCLVISILCMSVQRNKIVTSMK